MKKYILLGAFTTAVITVMFNLSAILLYNVPIITVTNLSENEYVQSVYVSGKIEEISKKDISYSIPIVTEAMYVEEGDFVELGEAIAKVDITKTREAIMDLLSLAQLLPKEYAYLLDEVSLDFDIESLEGLIPTQITANYSGVVSTINTVTGAITAPNQVVATISDLSELQAKISVAEKHATQITPGQNVKIYVDALDREYDATVKSIAPVAHDKLIGTSTQTVVNVNAIINNEDEYLKAGYNISGEIEIFAPKIVYTIPYSAINQDEDNNEFVYVYDNARAVKRYIKTGVEFSDYVEVVEGLTHEDIVVLDNVQVAYENQIVRVD